MGAEYSPQVAWPSHPHKAWNETLAHARQHGWSLRTFEGHTLGKVSCPTGECAVPVFSTGRSTENVARSTRVKGERCRHGGPAADRLAQIDDRVTRAERLLDACDELARRDEAERRLELLDEAAESLEAASAEFEAVFEQMVDAEARARAAFKAAGVSPGTGADALDGAGEQIQRPSGNSRMNHDAIHAFAHSEGGSTGAATGSRPYVHLISTPPETM